MNEAQTTLGIIDDDDDLRRYLARALGSVAGLSVIFNAASLSEARAALAQNSPDICLVDLGLPDGSGIELTREIKSASSSKVLILTVLGDRQSVLASLEAGADGYLLKDTPPDQIARLLKAVMEGNTPISPQAATHLLRAFTDSAGSAAAYDGDPITAREREVLNLFERGLSYAESAAALGISQNTVRAHVKSIYAKLDVRSRNEAVYEARNMGLLEG